MSIFDIFKKIESAPPAASGPVTWVVCGLGNPGDKYENTRHNSGFLALDLLAEKNGVRVDRLRFKAVTCEGTLALPGGKTEKVLYMKPQTFMNLSGEAVREALAFYHLPPEKLVVFCDDVAIAPGRVRVRAKGSHGGQNGLRNIILQLGTDAFPRVRIGIGEPAHPDMDMVDHVIGHFSDAEKPLVLDAARRAGEAAALLIASGTDAAMSAYNGSLPAGQKPASPENHRPAAPAAGQKPPEQSGAVGRAE